MKKLAVAALLPLAIAGTPAEAADVQSLSCISDKAGPAFIEKFGKVAAAVHDLSDTSSVSSDEYIDLLVSLTTNVSSCAEERGWSEAASEAASDYASSLFSISGMESLLGSKGMDAAKVRQAYEKLSVGQRASFGSEASDEAVQALLSGLGDDATDPEKAGYAGMFASTLGRMEARREVFIKN